MSTSQNRLTRPADPKQFPDGRRPISVLIESVVVFVAFAIPFVVGSYGAYHWGWSQERATLTILAGAGAVLVIWRLVHSVLITGEQNSQVKTAKIDPLAEREIKRTPAGALYSTELGDE